MDPYFEFNECVIYHGDCCEIMPTLVADCLIGDPPYSDRTHRGHDASEQIAGRNRLEFEPWDHSDIIRFIDAQRTCVAGWRVVFSDHMLQPAWEKMLSAIGLYVFAPIPHVVPGGRARLSGDGPASWTTWITVARPKEDRFSGFGALPGAYILPKGQRDKEKVIGGKDLWVMLRLVEDYSRNGETILDPVCGAGTTLVAAVGLGRKAVGIDSSERACWKAAKRMEALIHLGIESFGVNIK